MWLLVHCTNDNDLDLHSAFHDAPIIHTTVIPAVVGSYIVATADRGVAAKRLHSYPLERGKVGHNHNDWDGAGSEPPTLRSLDDPLYH